MDKPGLLAVLAMDKTTFHDTVVGPFLCKHGLHSYADPYKVSRLYCSFDFVFWSVAEQFGTQRCRRLGCTHERTVRRSGVAGPNGKAGRWKAVVLDPPDQNIEWFTPTEKS